MNISLFNIVVLQLFSDIKRLDNETIQDTHHVENCIHTCTFYTFMYNYIFIITLAILLNFCIYFNKINKYISFVKRQII